MDEFIAWLIGTPLGLFTVGGLIYLIIKKKKEEEKEAEEEKRKQLERKKKQKEKTMIITETKITKIRNLDKEAYEKISNRDNN